MRKRAEPLNRLVFWMNRLYSFSFESFSHEWHSFCVTQPICRNRIEYIYRNCLPIAFLFLISYIKSTTKFVTLWKNFNNCKKKNDDCASLWHKNRAQYKRHHMRKDLFCKKLAFIFFSPLFPYNFLKIQPKFCLFYGFVVWSSFRSH